MSMPLFDCVVVNVLVQAFPCISDTLSHLVHTFDFPAVNVLLKNSPHLVIDQIEVWTIWRPQ